MFAVIDVSEPETHITKCDTGGQAAEYVNLLSSANPAKRYRIIHVTEDTPQDDSWKARERNRFVNGTYKPTPWHNEPWANAEHFVHVSADDPSKVAFTENAAKGLADIQTRMKPGRYLAQFYSGSLSSEDIKLWCARYAEANGANKVLFATTADEIERVYVNGPSSCMSHDDSEYSSPYHPVRVYAAGDLAIAYLENADGTTARCVCYPDKKLYSRPYGYSDLLGPLLEALGYEYSSDALKGARMLRDEQNSGQFVAPYLDGIQNADDNGSYLIISDYGDIDCSSTNGLTQEQGEICDHCGDRYDSENEGTFIESIEGYWCEHCVNNFAFTCSHCNETQHNDNRSFSLENGNDICDDCADHYSRCEDCEEHFDADDMRLDLNSNCYCEDCAAKLETTPCGELSESKDDCDCRDCEDFRASLLPENFELSSDMPQSKPKKHTPSPTIHDPRQYGLLLTWNGYPTPAYRRSIAA